MRLSRRPQLNLRIFSLPSQIFDIGNCCATNGQVNPTANAIYLRLFPCAKNYNKTEIPNRKRGSTTATWERKEDKPHTTTAILDIYPPPSFLLPPCPLSKKRYTSGKDKERGSESIKVCFSFVTSYFIIDSGRRGGGTVTDSLPTTFLT